MRYADMITSMAALEAEAEVLDSKKRLGKNQKARRTAISEELSQMTQSQPPPTVRREPAEPVNGRVGGDWQGNVFAAHRRNVFGANSMSMRRMHRSPSRFGIQFKRSRIQRATRKQRTGGVR